MNTKYTAEIYLLFWSAKKQEMRPTR